MIEDQLPEKFKEAAFHPSLFIYAWKRNSLDKLCEEFLQSNIAILGGEAWTGSGELIQGVIPLQQGGKAVLNWKIKREKDEDWYDFVERSIKESLNVIVSENLEKKVSASTKSRLFYHFDLAVE